MVRWDQGRTLADRFRSHAGEATHLYGHAMRGMADDWEAGGPVRAVCAGYESAPPGSALALRLLAGVFRLVLTGRAPELVRFYPCLGGRADPAEAWPVLRAVIAGHPEELHAALAVPPQTNEVGRSVALLAGLFDVVAATGIRRVRLLEVGASAGLNLLVDRFAYSGPDWQFGDSASPVRFPDAISGPVRVADFTLVDRRGCDLHPVDPLSPDGRLLLTSFVWPFQVRRHERLTAALGLAAEHPVPVDGGSASSWLGPALEQTADEVLPVVWHSITRLYWPPEEVAAVETVLSAYAERRLLARVAMEFATGAAASVRPELQTTVWPPGQAPRHRRLGTAHDHGPPVRLDDVRT
jgi:hypothetical protein